MFNVVDTFWADQLSAQAIAALSLSMIPFWAYCLWGFSQYVIKFSDDILGTSNSKFTIWVIDL
jgi:hypothetical protein